MYLSQWVMVKKNLRNTLSGPRNSHRVGRAWQVSLVLSECLSEEVTSTRL